jgi:hypothetical protein
MSLPASPIPRRFYRVAFQRLEEADVLSNAGYHIGAVYLAGYAVECMLKSLILDATPEQNHEEVEAEFRGQRAHQYEWLRDRYAQTNAPGLPSKVNESLVFVSTWETTLRYKPGMGNPRDADRFLTEVASILEWADSRI